MNAHRPLGCFRHRVPQLDIVSGSFGSVGQNGIQSFLTQVPTWKVQVGEGINLLVHSRSMAPIHRVLVFSRNFDKAWRALEAAEDVKLIIKQGMKRKMSEVEGHARKLLLHRRHWCINDGTVSTTATELYGMHLRHAETQFMTLDELRERLLTDLLSIVRSGQNSFPAIDLAIKAFALLPDGSFNMPAFKQLKIALNIEEVDQVAKYFGRQVRAL